MNKHEFTLAEIFGIAIKRIWIILAAMIVGGLAALYYTSFLVTPKYESKTKYLVDTTGLSEAGYYAAATTASVEEQRHTVLSRLLVSSYIEILQTHNFSEFLAVKLESKTDLAPERPHPYTGDELFNMIKYTFEEDKEFYLVTVTADDPADAFIIARCIEENSESYLASKKASAQGTLKVIDNARTNKYAVNVNFVLNVIIGALCGAIIAFAAAFIVEINDVRIKSEKELVSTVGLPVIGSIPEQILYRDSPSSSQSRRKASK